MTEPRMPGFRDIDEASDRIRAITVPLIPVEWARGRGEVFARFGQAIAMAQILEAELRVTVSLMEDTPIRQRDDLRIRPQTLGKLASLMKERDATSEKDTKDFHDALAEVVKERNTLAHSLFRTRLLMETPNSNVDDLSTEAGRLMLNERLGNATGQFAYFATLLSDLNKFLSANPS